MHYFKQTLLSIFATLLIVSCAYNPTVDIGHAAMGRKVQHLQEYIDKGVDVNFQDEDGETPLMLAVLFRRAENVKLLLAAGADVHIKSKDGTTAMTALDQIEPVNREIVELLVTHGADINEFDTDGYNALTTAMLYHDEDDNRISDIQFLLDKGADVNAKEQDGSPIFWSICQYSEENDYDYRSVLELFLAYGLDINAKDNEDDNLLVLKSCQENPDLYDYLVSRGAKE